MGHIRGLLLLSICLSAVLVSNASRLLNYEAGPSLDGRMDVLKRRQLVGTGYWSTKGNKIVDTSGHEVWFTGLTWYGFDSSSCVADGIPTKSIEEHFDLIQQLGFNFIRIPFSTVCVNESSVPEPQSTFSTSKYAGWTSLNILDAMIKNATARNIRVGLFWIRPNNSLSAETEPTKRGIWYNDAIPYATEDYWIKTLKFIAKRYYANPAVIGMGLFHEPHNDDDSKTHPDLIWLPNNSSSFNYYRAAKRAGDSIHSVNPKLLIFVQGLSDTNSTTYPSIWWGSGLATVAKYPLNLTVPNKVVYQVHDFDTATFTQPYFNSPGLESTLPNVWDQAWGFVRHNDIGPIFVAEFGTNTSLANTTSRDVIWFNTLIKYIKDNSLRWSILTWGEGGKHGGLWDSNFTTLHCDKLNLLLPIFHDGFGPSPLSSSLPNSTFPTQEYISLCPVQSVQKDTSSGLPPWAIFLISFFSILVLKLILIAIAIYYFQDCLPSWMIALINRYKPDRVGMAKFIPLKTLYAATNGFSRDNIVGSGGFGTVYKGIGPRKQIWAIKRAKNVTEKDNLFFENEVKLISKMNHRYVVQLIGFCDEEGQQILIYEFMTNGMLTTFLRKKKPEDSIIPLTFHQRLRIALTSSQGLEYLHSHATEGIFHRDIKSDNILLNENMEGKISDFGLLKQIPSQNPNSTTENMSIVGTKGYIDPEYIQSYVFTKKSDVYSFGVVMLELITGRPPIFKDPSGERILTLPEWARENMNDLDVVMDPHMGSVPVEKVKRFFDLALRCTERSSTYRPLMNEVSRELKKITAVTESDFSDLEVQIAPLRTGNDSASFDVDIDSTTEERLRYLERMEDSGNIDYSTSSSHDMGYNHHLARKGSRTTR